MITAQKIIVFTWVFAVGATFFAVIDIRNETAQFGDIRNEIYEQNAEVIPSSTTIDFIDPENQRSGLLTMRIIVHSETGCQYAFTSSSLGQAGFPLLNPDGTCYRATGEE